ncbi:MAG: c-type cytochrome biogenesis protein CcsB [Jiangellaceae bacterium]
MDAATLGEWSRYVVSGAVAAFMVAWLAYCAETAYLVRTARAATVADRERVLAGAAADLDSRPGPVADPPTARPGQAGPVRQMASIGFSVSVLATALLAVGVVMRAIAVSRAPWGNMYEFSITAALVASVVFLAVARTKAGRALAVWVVLLIFMTLALAATVLYVAPGPLLPALRSYWLVVHVGAAVTAFGLFTVAAVVSALQIVAERAERKGVSGGFASVLPTSTKLDRLSYRLITAAFPVWTFGPLILGAIWAEASWGRYWGWDPKEVWALITWLAYAAFLHARATAGWRGSKASAVSLVAYGTLLFSYYGVNVFFSGLHAYGGL